MHLNSESGCHKRPLDQAGDVDENGDLVGSLFGLLPTARATRLEGAMSESIADDVDRGDQLELVARMIRVRG